MIKFLYENRKAIFIVNALAFLTLFFVLVGAGYGPLGVACGAWAVGMPWALKWGINRYYKPETAS